MANRFGDRTVWLQGSFVTGEVWRLSGLVTGWSGIKGPGHQVPIIRVMLKSAVHILLSTEQII